MLFLYSTVSVLNIKMDDLDLLIIEQQPGIEEDNEGKGNTITSN